MNVLIFGATGSIGRQLVKQGLEAFLARIKQ
jgi:FlaA1/EpsC-like NDP-sugar epimerase